MGWIPIPPPEIREPYRPESPDDPTPEEYAAVLRERGLGDVSKYAVRPKVAPTLNPGTGLPHIPQPRPTLPMPPPGGSGENRDPLVHLMRLG